MAFPQHHFQQHYQTQQQQQPQNKSFRNLQTIDGQMSQQVAFYNPTDLQDQSQHPPYIPPFHVVGFAPGPVPPADGSDGGVDLQLQWNYGLEPERKRLKEQDFLENNSQISSVDFLQPRSVSTGLGLSLDNTRLTSTGDSALLSLIGDDIERELQQQDAEIDRFLKVQGGRLRQAVLEKVQATQLQSVSLIEDKILQKLREKEAMVESINKRNIELEDQMEQLTVEAGSWQQRARYNENMIAALKFNLQQAYVQSRDSKEGCGDSEVDDTASCCNGRSLDFHLLSRENTDMKEMMTCKATMGGMDYADPKRKGNFVGKVFLAAALTTLCIIMIKQSPSLNSPSPFAVHEPGVTHVLVTGGAGYIGSHATLRLLKENYRVTIVDNLSRGNLGAIKVLQDLFPEPGRLQFIYADLGDPISVNKIFLENKFDAVMHFAAVAYVGESTGDPLKYYHNITSNTLLVLESMAKHDVKTLIYSSTCATYGEPEKMPITEETKQVPINPYGKAKKMAEDIILDFSKNSEMAVMILRYFNVIGSDPEGRLGEAPRPELREQGRISGACFDAARGIVPGIKVRGTDYKTADGTCVRDYIDVTDLVDAHVKALEKAQPSKVRFYNVGTGKGSSVKEFVEACKKATGVDIKVDYLPRRPGDYAEVYSDPTKIKHELNWTAKQTDLQQSLKVAWRWQKSHRDGYGVSNAVL